MSSIVVGMPKMVDEAGRKKPKICQSNNVLRENNTILLGIPVLDDASVGARVFTAVQKYPFLKRASLNPTFIRKSLTQKKKKIKGRSNKCSRRDVQESFDRRVNLKYDKNAYIICT